MVPKHGEGYAKESVDFKQTWQQLLPKLRKKYRQKAQLKSENPDVVVVNIKADLVYQDRHTQEWKGSPRLMAAIAKVLTELKEAKTQKAKDGSKLYRWSPGFVHRGFTQTGNALSLMRRYDNKLFLDEVAALIPTTAEKRTQLGELVLLKATFEMDAHVDTLVERLAHEELLSESDRSSNSSGSPKGSPSKTPQPDYNPMAGLV